MIFCLLLNQNCKYSREITCIYCDILVIFINQIWNKYNFCCMDSILFSVWFLYTNSGGGERAEGSFDHCHVKGKIKGKFWYWSFLCIIAFQWSGSKSSFYRCNKWYREYLQLMSTILSTKSEEIKFHHMYPCGLCGCSWKTISPLVITAPSSTALWN